MRFDAQSFSETLLGDLQPWLPETSLTSQGERARSSLAEFVRQAWHVVEPDTPLVWNWHIDAICQHLEAVTDGRIRRLIVNIPPGHCKSLLTCVFWPAWEWVKSPSLRTLFGSYSIDLALRDSMKCRDLISSEWYQDTFQPIWRLKGDQNVKSNFSNTLTGFRFCFSVGGRMTGFRGHKWIIDDPLNVTESWSATARQTAIDFIDRALSSRLNNPQTGARVIIGQRLHEDDPCGHILRRGGWEHLCLPSEFEPERRSTTSIGWTDPRKDPGDLLFPAFFTPAVLEEARNSDLGPLDYAGQHQQRPAPAEGALFKAEWFANRYLSLPKLVEVWTAWDTALKVGELNDETACVTAGRGEDGNVYLLDCSHGRWATPEVEEKLAKQAAYCRTRYGSAYRGDLVEDKVSGTTLMQYLRRSHPEIPVIAVKAEADKVSRAHGILPMCEAGQVRLPDAAAYPESRAWADDLLGQLLMFPNSTHDDMVDSFVYVCTRVIRKKEWVIV